MSTMIRLTPRGEALLQKQLANGLYRSPEEVVERALETLAENGEQSRVSTTAMTPAEAVADIQANRKGVKLGGLKIRDLIHRGQKCRVSWSSLIRVRRRCSPVVVVTHFVFERITSRCTRRWSFL